MIAIGAIKLFFVCDWARIGMVLSQAVTKWGEIREGKNLYM